MSPDHIPATVRALRVESASVVSVELAAADGAALPGWEPGAHIELNLPTGLARQYSLCGSPADRSGYRIGVLRERASRGGSEYVHAFLRPGQRVRIRPPVNTFTFGPAGAYLFIAGGIGITPILPMVHRAAAEGRDWQLVYSGRTAATMAFLDELRPYGPRVHLYPADRGGRAPLAEWLGTPEPGTAIYTCGPEGLLNGIEAESAHWPAGALHTERFKARPRTPQPNAEVEVVCARSDRTVTVPPERSILAALEDAGLPVTGSCREGVCGTCETRVLEGIPDHRDDILSDSDRTANDRMYICVSRARGTRLVLDV